ncbi:hypothetical protein SAPIO_CDS4182 [Scedosporium apiospermum]|uniref:Glucose-methanol-choline oxidoreductase N-terminal domain-containing protein n=1 Tax=Pseudallescheria apiosperma TaxID=563466 RepID=A0A084G9F9_PSEDA|nr:uncharacterized protein SAPIO_CDS4182 [Scedosporium apiospermum]KEZ43971.1 hypothetical protein SAPIO_CDS4182 [Scedosporium apiospermum]
MPAPKDGAHFDFIVVGGGTAGNAGRGGPENEELITTPSSAMELRGSDYDWGYKTTLVRRDDYERIEKPNTCGKVLGGSSSLNYFTWVPGCKPTFDRWAEFGGQEWTWDPLVHYLRKSATYHDDLGLYSKDLQKVGKGGPLPVSHAELLDEFADFRDRVTKAWVSRGHKIQENIYDGEMIGLTHCLDTIYKGQRSGSYLFVKNKPNITILAYTHAKNIILDAGLTAKGVVVIGPNGGEQSFYATREVIVSEGVFESPKLLMLSGIGPRDQLERYGIRTLVESNHVGQNLIDHPGVPFVLQVKDGYGADDHLLRQSSKFSVAAETYKRIGPKDPLYKERKAANGSKDPFSPEGQPHFELDFVCMFGSAFQWHFPTPKKGNHITVVVDLVRPVSGPGEVTLQSNDPLAQPAINLNFFADDLDIIGMREGIRFIYDVLTKGEGFKDIVVAEYPWDMPLDDDKQMERAVLDRGQTAFHPTGTCRLSKNIGQGVVDPKLKVHGVKNLRVIDASVIPIIPDCRIQNSVSAVGEKGADMIKEAHKDLQA